MIKFGRNYRLTIQSNGDDPSDIVIEYPLTVQFDITRGAMASLNSMNLVIYNLSETTRRQIFQDRFGYYDGVSGQLAYRRVILEAGYGQDLSIVFQGNLFEASSARQGSNILTFIDARDGGFDVATTKTFATYAKGTQIRDLLLTLMSQFQNLNQGEVGNIEGEFKRPVVIDGNTLAFMQLYSNNNTFIDLEKIHVLGDNEVIEGIVPLISDETGLLETPRRDDAYLTVTTLFEPRILMSQIIKLESTINPIYNGQYKVIGVKHSGIISGSVSGECKSTFGLLLDGQLFGKFNVVTSNITRTNLESQSN